MSEPERRDAPSDEASHPQRDAQRDAPVDAEDGDAAERYKTVRPFRGARLERELLADAVLRWALVLVAALGFVVVLSFGVGVTTAAVVALGLVVAVWLLLNLTSARISRDLPRLGAMIEAEPALAEDHLARHLRARPLLAWVRLMLYHRLAGLRHRQQRYEESLAICAAVLPHHLGPARDARGHLLLMLVEAALERRDLISAYHGLLELHGTRLSLVEALQRLALQTRYEVLCGHHDHALWRAAEKVQLAELMPAAQCGAVHAILATAATHTRQEQLAHWLWQRTELLCTPEQVRQLRAGGSGIGIVA